MRTTQIIQKKTFMHSITNNNNDNNNNNNFMIITMIALFGTQTVTEQTATGVNSRSSQHFTETRARVHRQGVEGGDNGGYDGDTILMFS